MFENRSDAGIRLSTRLLQYKDRRDVIVLALPRGGVATGYEIARALNAPLDVLIVRKLGFPGQPELAVGAIAETGTVVVNEDIVATGYVSEDFLKREVDRQKEEIARRDHLSRGEEVSRSKGHNSHPCRRRGRDRRHDKSRNLGAQRRERSETGRCTPRRTSGNRRSFAADGR